MDRAWISTGRRPNGLCGSAILIAARVHGFRVSTSEIVRVAHVCEETIRKRLTEFKHTNIARLTAAEVKQIEHQPVEESMDPPSFTKKLLALEMEQAGLSITDSDLKSYQQVLKDRESKINQKLEKSQQIVTEPVEQEEPEPDFQNAISLLEEQSVIKYDDLPAISDADIDKMILTDQERLFKARIWNNLNKQWLVDQKQKKRNKKLERKA